jgi:hypothetical protein
VNHIHRRLLGESLREIGVLILVFVPLDMVLRDHAPDLFVYPSWVFWLQWLSMSQWVEVFFGVAGISLLYYGIKVETNATLEEQKEDKQDVISNPTV